MALLTEDEYKDFEHQIKLQKESDEPVPEKPNGLKEKIDEGN